MPVPTHIFDPPFNIVRSSHAVLDVVDLNASREFYENIVGLHVEDLDLTPDDEHINVKGKGAKPLIVLLDDPRLVRQLRHTHATELVNEGVSLTTIRKRLGHKNVQTTLHYAEQSDATADAELRAWRRQRLQKG